jgi:cyclohexa-1,5-dienecarbonyl-CoA hydratase
MSYKTIQFHPGPRVTTIVLNRPPLNVINLEMMDELNAAWDEIEAMESQVIVISGAGERAFSAGVDVADHVPDRLSSMLSKFHRLIRRIFESDRITIAAIHGHTLGGGAELAMVCDFVLAADDASLGQPEISLACYPPVAAAYLPRAIGFHRASQLVLLGESIIAEEAERIGIVTKVVPAQELSKCVDDYVDRLLTKSSTAIALTKKALREGLEHRFESALTRTEKIYIDELAHTEDMQEGVDAFLHKRPPNWKNH